MKKLFAVLLCFILLMGFTGTVANAEGDKVTFTLTGYEVGAKISDITISADVNWLDIAGYEIYDPEDSSIMDVAGEFKRGEEYALMIFVRPNASVVVDDEASSFELSNGYSEKVAGLAGEDGEVIMIGFVLIPYSIPATGDGANIALWAALLVCSTVGMIIVACKARKSC